MDDVINVAEAARLAGVSAEWIRKLCAQGRIEGARKLGRDWLIPAGAKIAASQPRPLRTTEIPRKAEEEGLKRANWDSRSR